MAFVEDLLGNGPNRWILAPEFIHLYQWPLFIVTSQISMLELSNAVGKGNSSPLILRVKDTKTVQ